MFINMNITEEQNWIKMTNDQNKSLYTPTFRVTVHTKSGCIKFPLQCDQVLRTFI